MSEEDQPQYRLSVVAQMVEIHPATIRKYERHGLVRSHAREGERLYSELAVLRIRRIVTATQLGVNLSGAEVVCNLLERLEEKESELAALREQLRRLLD